MTKEEAIKYVQFMNNPDNIRKCDKCPENKNTDQWQDRLPCGQWHCWVSQHVQYNSKD